MDPVTVSLVLVITFVLYWLLTSHDSHLPPMPCRPYPVLGHLWHLDKNPRQLFKKWRNQCGDIFSLYMGSSLVVVLSGYGLIKEALVKQGDSCSDRPYMFFDAATGSTGRGISFSSGSLWREQRAVTMNILKTLGVGRNILALKIAQIAAMNNEALVSLKGKAADIKDIITTSVTNVTCYILVGHVFAYDDEVFTTFCQNIREMVLTTEVTNMGNFFKWISYIPGDIFHGKKIRKYADYVMQNFVFKYVQQKGYDEYDETNLDNFIALYIFEMKKKMQNGEVTSLNKENLIKVIFDIFSAGMETTSTTLMWCILYMLHYPALQEKVYAEIEKEVGTERPINAFDRVKLPYVNAVIMEVQRLASILSLNLTHQCSENIKLQGFDIPKGTQLITNLDSVHFDKNIWGEDADEFRPERFLDRDGKLTNPNIFIPFAIGKRMCAGEALARLELFLFFGSMIQRFTFVPVEAEALPSLEPVYGIVCIPASFQVRAIDRTNL